MQLDLTEEKWQALLVRQEERESVSLAAGEEQFRRQIEREAQRNEFSRTSVARRLLKHGIEPLEKAIEAWLVEAKRPRSDGRGGMKHYAVKWIERVGVPVATYLTLKTVVDGIVQCARYANVCSKLSDFICDELRYRELRAKAPGLFEYKLAHFNTSSYAHMARSMDHACRTAHDEQGNPLNLTSFTMGAQEKLRVGSKLIELLEASTGLVQVVRKHVAGQRRPKTPLYLEATPETETWLFKRADHLSLLQAVNAPMIVPPRQWGPEQRGGFRFGMREKYGLLRSHDSEHELEVEKMNLPLVYAALNAIQNTAWRINLPVYNLLREIERRGGGMAGIPPVDSLPLPPRPFDIETNEEARRAWRKRAGAVKEQNHERILKAREVQRTLSTAEDVLNEDAIYFPHSLDFRGRIYPLAEYLHPQRDDMGKALLTFAQGKIVDADAARWLAIHGANCLGEAPEGKMSRMTFDERVSWIHAHTTDIIAVADDPFANGWWATADAPLQFFAFCVEWRNLVRATDKGEEYVSTLPVSMDGSCNGLQHFSAMLRDDAGAVSVNVTPQARPQDIYQQVADAVLDKLEQLAPTDALAAKLLGSGLVTRKLAKRPTMTFGYGSKKFGFKQQLKDYLRGLDNWRQIRSLLSETDPETGKPKSQVNAACALFAKLIWDSLGEVVSKASEGMQWMQQCARGIAQTGKHVEWTVPLTGLRVQQFYPVWRKQAITTVLAGKAQRPCVYLPTAKPDTVKQANAIAPNVIHSLDAAALMLTVSQAAAEGVEAFAMVHDSYGTLAADCTVLMRACRQAFVRLYTHEDVSALLYSEFASQWEDPAECPAPPVKGTLDVSAVLGSDYFFA